MRELIAFTHVSLDGYFADANSDMSFAHRTEPDPEWNEFVEGNASGGGVLLFGRITYDLMVSFWPTPLATQTMPLVAERMNNLPKVVFSRTMAEASWKNTKLVTSDMAGAVRAMKAEPGEGMVILGSGSIVSQLTQHGLIDSYQIVVNPVALGQGKALFGSLESKVPLRLTATRGFGNGNVLLCYEPLSRSPRVG